MRKHIVAGNWKMNKTLEDGLSLASEVANIVKDEVNDGTQLILCPPSYLITDVQKVTEGVEGLSTGAQNCYDKESGAYTGEISASMVKSTGADYVIIGHSERREYFAESNEMLAAKVDIVLENGLTPIFCCGESLELREAGTHVEFVTKQLTESLFHLDAATLQKVVIAYEPIWAIGTGVTASTEQAQDMHADLRAHLASKYGTEVAAEISILYGGSCKPDNAPELFASEDIDGGLIGGAALDARSFVEIAKSFA